MLNKDDFLVKYLQIGARKLVLDNLPAWSDLGPSLGPSNSRWLKLQAVPSAFRTLPVSVRETIHANAFAADVR